MVDDIRDRPPVIHRSQGLGRLTKVAKVRPVDGDEAGSKKALVPKKKQSKRDRPGGIDVEA